MPTDAAPDRIVVGRVVKPHGIQGEVVVEAQTEAPDVRFRPGATLLAGDPSGEPRPVRVAAARPHQGRYIVSLDGVGDRDAAERLRGSLLSIPAAEARPAGPDRYYPHELQGLAVTDEAGSALGTMTSVLEYPANDVWVVRTPQGNEVLVPAVKEIVVEVDLAGGRIVLRPIPGLFEEA